MGLAKKLSENMNEWVKLAMIIIVASLVLVKYQTSAIICASGYTFNSTAGNCYLTTNASVTATPLGNLVVTINRFVSAFSEPSNWVAIVIIAFIGYGIIRFFRRKFF